jgi:Zn ribbon nucleic-acid-binding protein
MICEPDFAEDGGLVVPCPMCCEARADYLVWLDYETVRCVTCGHEFKPEEL